MQCEPLESRRLLAAGQPDLVFGVGGETTVTTPNTASTAVREVFDLGDEGLILRTADGLALLDRAGRPLTGFSGDGFFQSAENIADADLLNDVSQVALLTGFGIRQVDGSGNIVGDYGGGDGLADFPANVVPQRVVGDAGGATYLVSTRTSDGMEGVTVTKYAFNGDVAGSFGTIDVTTFIDDIDVLDAFGGAGGNLYIVTRADTGSSLVYSVVEVSPTGANTAVNFATIDKDEGIEITYAGGGVLNNGDPRVVYTNGEQFFFSDPFDNDTVQLQRGTDYVSQPVSGFLSAQVDPGGRVTLFGQRLGEVLPFGVARFVDDGSLDVGYGNGGYTELAGQPLATSAGGVLAFAGSGTSLDLTRIAGGSSRALPGPVWIGFADGKLRVDGTNDGDSIRITLKPDRSRFVVRSNGAIRSFPTSSGRSIDVLSKDGDDLVELGADVDYGLYADGSTGNDTLRGGVADDILLGDADDDFLYGNAGRDRLFGGGGDDFIFGGDDKDYAEGGSGNDSLNGNAQADTLFGNAGLDTVNGAGGNDSLFGGADADDIRGGSGTDAAEDDVLDSYDSVEELLD